MKLLPQSSLTRVRMGSNFARFPAPHKASEVGLCSDIPIAAAERGPQASSIALRIAESSFSGLLTRFEIGHIRIGSEGNVVRRLCGSGSEPSHRSWSCGRKFDRECG